MIEFELGSIEGNETSGCIWGLGFNGNTLGMWRILLPRAGIGASGHILKPSEKWGWLDSWSWFLSSLWNIIELPRPQTVGGEPRSVSFGLGTVPKRPTRGQGWNQWCWRWRAIRMYWRRPESNLMNSEQHLTLGGYRTISWMTVTVYSRTSQSMSEPIPRVRHRCQLLGPAWAPQMRFNFSWRNGGRGKSGGWAPIVCGKEPDFD